MCIAARQVEQVFPELVNTSDRAEKTVNDVKPTLFLLKSIWEQQAMIDELDRRVDAL